MGHMNFDIKSRRAEHLRMSNLTREQLIERVAELEEELLERQTDLKRFRSELGKANQRLEALISQISSELKLAHVLQRALVPTEFPHISGFEFSTKFVPSPISGGDYFDIFEHQDRFRFGVIVSSSSGHTMSALLLGILLKMTSQLESKKGSEPHEVLKDMAEQIRAEDAGQDEADIFYALVDRRNYDMRFVKAGQVVVLHQSFVTGEVQALESGLGSLNMNFQAPGQSGSIFLNPRDRMVICTRGVMDARNGKGEPYGVERVTRSFLSGPKRGVHELRNHLLYEVQKFTQAPEPARDQTIVVLEVKDKVIKLAKS